MYWIEKGGIVGQFEGRVGGIAPDGVNEEVEISVENYGCMLRVVVIYCGEDSIMEYCVCSY